MADRTGIEWTDSTWNPIRARRPGGPTGADPMSVWERPRVGSHCEKVSAACQHCYAERMNRWIGTGLEYKPGHRDDVTIFVDDKILTQPLRWKKPRKIFVCSMTDLFGEWVSDDMIDRVFAMMALASQHTFQLLTKRAERMRAYVTCRRRDTVYSEMAVIGGVEGNHDLRVDWPLPNVWLGVTAEDQLNADKRIPILLDTPAAIRFVSCEPLLGPIDLTTLRGPPIDFEDAPRRAHWINALTGEHGTWLATWQGIQPDKFSKLDQVITGGESGSHARPMHPDWARSIRTQCQAAGVPFFFKQWGGKNPRSGGRLLDGIEWGQFPGGTA